MRDGNTTERALGSKHVHDAAALDVLGLDDVDRCVHGNPFSGRRRR